MNKIDLQYLLAKFVRQKRISLKLTQEELAHISHMSRTGIVNIEGKITGFKMETIERILNAMEVTLDELGKFICDEQKND